MNKINDDFLLELFKLCFRNKTVVNCCIQHLEYHYIELESYKNLWRDIRTYFLTQDKLPTIGVIAQSYISGTKLDKEVLEVLEKIKQIDIPTEDSVLTQLEEYIKNSISIEFYDKFESLYNKGEKDKARILLTQVGEKLAKFSIKSNTQPFERVFGSFRERQIRRKLTNSLDTSTPLKVIFGIDEIDNNIGGGVNKGDIALLLMQSGVGKSTWLRWIGVSNARRGLKGLHWQLEGTKEECEDAYDATWTAQSVFDLEYGNIDEDIFEKLLKINNQLIANGGDIFIESHEEFGSASCTDLRNRIIEFEKLNGVAPDFVLVDYFELLEPGDGKKYLISQERQRREAISKLLKQIAMEFKTVIITPTQSSTVSPEDLNRPEFVQTRYHISEFKGALKPFSYFFTGNQTEDEYKSGVMRIFADKIRKYKRGWVATILQAYNHGKFYDRRRTMKEYHNMDV